jgi:hypothetical protein
MLYLLSLLASVFTCIRVYRRYSCHFVCNFIDLNDIPVNVTSTLEDGVLAEKGGICDSSGSHSTQQIPLYEPEALGTP